MNTEIILAYRLAIEIKRERVKHIYIIFVLIFSCQGDPGRDGETGSPGLPGMRVSLWQFESLVFRVTHTQFSTWSQTRCS